MFKDRVSLYEELQNKRRSKIINYVTGSKPGYETQIQTDVFDYFAEHLDNIGVTEKISLMLYTYGGSTLAAWSIINLIRQFCEELEIIIPSNCRSAGTLMTLGADNIIMTKQATLGPIDPSLNTAINPIIPNSNNTYPVSVEAVNGYIEFVKKVGVHAESELSKILLHLSERVHPLVLGQMHRSRSQIKMLAYKLLEYQDIKNENSKTEIVSFLCSDSGSHDYTINRREAKELGLIVNKPDPEEYRLINEIYKDYKVEMGLNEPFNPLEVLNGEEEKEYNIRRLLIESVDSGSHSIITSGRVYMKRPFEETPQFNPATSFPVMRPPQNGYDKIPYNEITFEGWRHEK